MAEGGLAVLVPDAPAVVPEDVLHEPVAVVRAVQRLAEPPEVLRGVLGLLGELDDVGVVHLRRLQALGLHDVLADEEHGRHGVARDGQELPVGLHQPLGERQEAAAGSRDLAGDLADVAQGRAVPHGAVDVHLGEIRGVAGLDRRDELLLPIPEGGPVELDLDVPLLCPDLDVLREHVVAGGHEALEQPDAELGARLGAGHRPQGVEAGGGAAGDERRATQELAPGDQARIELFGSFTETRVGHGRLPGRWVIERRHSESRRGDGGRSSSVRPGAAGQAGRVRVRRWKLFGRVR